MFQNFWLIICAQYDQWPVGRLSGYTHALRIKKSPSSFALRIKKGDQLGGSGGENGEDDYYDNYSNVPDSEYYTGADSDDVITGDTAQYNNMQKRDMNSKFKRLIM